MLLFVYAHDPILLDRLDEEFIKYLKNVLAEYAASQQTFRPKINQRQGWKYDNRPDYSEHEKF